MRPIFTKLLDNPRSHLAQHMKSAYPATAELRKLVAQAAGPLLVPPGDAHAGTVGTAFDLLSGFVLIPDYVPIQRQPGGAWQPLHALLATRMTEYAHACFDDRAQDDEFYQCVWVLAELASIIRAGYSHPDSPLAKVLRGKPGLEQLYSVVPPDGIRQLRAMEALAEEYLYPHLDQPIIASASFPAAAELVQAEADLIAGGMLLDYKTTIGTLRKNVQARVFLPSAIDIYQILGYGLMDTDDGYGVDTVGLYAARYGFSSVWPLDQLLGITAGGHAVNIDDARARFREALRADAG